MGKPTPSTANKKLNQKLKELDSNKKSKKPSQSDQKFLEIFKKLSNGTPQDFKFFDLGKPLKNSTPKIMAPTAPTGLDEPLFWEICDIERLNKALKTRAAKRK